MADVIDTLNDLISACLDSEEGFGKAAKGAHGDAMRHRFMGIVRQQGNTLRHYEGALTTGLPEPVCGVVEQQRLAVAVAMEQLRDLEQLRKAG